MLSPRGQRKLAVVDSRVMLQFATFIQPRAGPSFLTGDRLIGPGKRAAGSAQNRRDETRQDKTNDRDNKSIIIVYLLAAAAAAAAGHCAAGCRLQLSTYVPNQFKSALALTSDSSLGQPLGKYLADRPTD